MFYCMANTCDRFDALLLDVAPQVHLTNVDLEGLLRRVGEFDCADCDCGDCIRFSVGFSTLCIPLPLKEPVYSFIILHQQTTIVPMMP